MSENFVHSIEAGLENRWRSIEHHRNVLKLLLRPGSVPPDYIRDQDILMDGFSGGAMVVDASKYVARAVAIGESERHSYRYVYVVRDARGVVFSLMKSGRLGRPRRNLAESIVYYAAVNLAAQIAMWTRLRHRCIKIRYEDLVKEPRSVLTKIGQFLDLDVSGIVSSIDDGEPIKVGHIASGNRMRMSGSVQLSIDEQWRREMSPWMKGVIYMTCFPLQVLNRYFF